VQVRVLSPLFQTKVLQSELRAFAFPEDLEQRHKVLLPWLKALRSGTLDEVKEVSLHGDFLHDIFQKVLGYRSVVAGEGQTWEVHAEQTISDGGGSADGALGIFTAVSEKKGSSPRLSGQILAPIELKGAADDLDRPSPGRRESAVEQGWRYANHARDCRWVLVSNYREIRLYHTRRTPALAEVFMLEELAEKEDQFKKFYFLLSRDRFLPARETPSSQSKTDQLLTQSEQADEDLTSEFYTEYKELRLLLVKHFLTSAPQDIKDRNHQVIERAQKVLDRILFIAFAEDKGLLPKQTLANAYIHKDPYKPRPIWDNYKSVFRWIDTGNKEQAIPGYNGGLFRLDPLLDEALTVPDDICSRMKDVSRFDFDTEISVNILGQIFEQSITDLEELRAISEGREFDKKKGKRKQQGGILHPAIRHTVYCESSSWRICSIQRSFNTN